MAILSRNWYIVLMEDNTSLQSPIRHHQQPETAPLIPQAPTFPAKVYLLIITAFVSLGLAYALIPLELTYRVVSLLLLVAGIAQIGFVYFVQTDYLRQFYPQKNLLPHFILLAAMILLPVIGITLGDYIGAAHFSDEPEGMASNLQLGLSIGIFLAVCCTLFLIAGNALFIMTRGLLSAITILGKIIYGIGCLFIVFISFFLYNLQYTLHDPSTE